MKTLLLSVTMLMLIQTDCFAFGVLFTTPVQRNNLNLMRNGSTSQAIISVKKTKKQVSLNGFVKRQNAVSTAWINNTPSDEHSDNHSKIKLHAINKNNVKLSMPGWSTPVELRPGQVIDLTKNKIIESYQRPLSRPASTLITNIADTE